MRTRHLSIRSLPHPGNVGCRPATHRRELSVGIRADLGDLTPELL